jgi:predicted amidohydrolase
MKLILVQPRLRLELEADNVGVIRTAIEGARLEPESGDILLLPESFHRSADPARYERELSSLARSLGCHVVGGSRRERVGGRTLNSGLVFDAQGESIGRYEKLRPYAAERTEVDAGSMLGEVVINGRNVLVLVCADLWFADVFQYTTQLPDLVLVPALSVTRKPTPEYSRALWRHLAVSRAYEFGAYVGVSDWHRGSDLPILLASGVGGFADPTAVEPERLFTAIGERTVSVHALDFDALETFRRDRSERGFFWWKNHSPLSGGKGARG